MASKTITSAAHEVTCDVCRAVEFSAGDGSSRPVYPEGWRRISFSWAPANDASPHAYHPPGGEPVVTHSVERPNPEYRRSGYRVNEATIMVEEVRPYCGKVVGDVCPACQQRLTMAAIIEAFQLAHPVESGRELPGPQRSAYGPPDPPPWQPGQQLPPQQPWSR